MQLHFLPRKLLLITLVACAVLATRLQAQVLINEIMYHPASGNPAEEFIELYNPGPAGFDLTGWHFTKGITYTFPQATLAAGGYLVVAANPAVFQTKYPGVTAVFGPWQGTLSNNGEEISLANAAGAKSDSVRYATQGDWAVRKKGPLDYGHRGWIWFAEHDGGGPSLERINPALPNEGQNWGSSKTVNGTPGARNSIARDHTAPLILKAVHSPIIPTPSDLVTVAARIVDDQPGPVTVTIYFRIDGTTAFSDQAMRDDGQHGDGVAGDGVYGTFLPAHSAGRIMEFYLKATDAQGNSRTFPAPVQPTGTQVANLLYQVQDTAYNGPQPLYRLIMTKAERDELDALSAVFDDTLSNAQMNGTFISVDENGTEVRYLVGLRNRGHGTRIKVPHNFRVNFRNDQTWHGVDALELNTQFTHAQILGAVLAQRSGLVVADARPAQVRVNNANLAKSGSPQFGSYAALEALNKDFVDNHFPLDSGGNLYRGIESLFPATNQADLVYLGDDPNLYRENYHKQNNNGADDWSDLIGLLKVLTQTPDATFAREVYRVLNVDEAMAYLAFNAAIENEETTINTGVGDDYALYRGVNDPRFILIPYDHDTILNIGDDPGTAKAGLFRSARLRIIKRLLDVPDFQALYHWHLQDLITTTFSADSFNGIVDEVLGTWVSATNRAKIKTFAGNRREYIRSQIPAVIRAAIASQPKSQTARAGDRVTFSVGAVGTEPLTYQWYHQGLPLPGANSASLPLIAEPDTVGSYAVTVSNAGAAVTSLDANLALSSGLPDSDGDGLPDDWEIANGFNPASPNDASGDADGDSLTNLQEYLSGTNPRDPGSRLSLAVGKLSDGEIAVSFPAMPGRSYTIEYRDGFGPGGWTKLIDFPAGSFQQQLQITASPSGSTPRFYRLVTPQQP